MSDTGNKARRFRRQKARNYLSFEDATYKGEEGSVG